MRDVLRVAPRVRIATLADEVGPALFVLSHSWIIHCLDSTCNVTSDEQSRCDQGAFLSMVHSAQVEMSDMMERDNRSKATPSVAWVVIRS